MSVPVQERPVPSPAGAVVTRAADGGWLLEGGLSAAGSFLAWLGRLLDRSTEELGRLAAESRPGARGVVAVPWLDGARAPWWRDDARAGFMGLGAAHGAADMARAVMESVAWDVLRVMEVVTVGRLGGSTAEGVTLGGAGSGLPVWVEVLTSVLGVPALRHRSGEAASAGAALLAGKALGLGLTLDQLDPVEAVIEPDPAAVEVYRALRPRVDHVARGRAGRHRVAPGTGPPRALTRARRAGLRPPRDRRSRCPTAPRSSSRWTSRASTTRQAAITDALRQPAGRAAAAATLVAAAGTGGRRLPRPDPAHAEPHRAAHRCWRSWRAAGVPDDRITLLCATGTHRQATAAEMAELVGPDIVARYTDRRPRRDERRRTCAWATVDGTPVLLQREYVEADVRIVTGLRRAALLRRLQRRPQGGLPGTGRHRDHPGGAPPPPHRRRPGHLRARGRATRCTTSSGPPPRWRRRTCRSTSPSTGRAR